MKTRRVRDVCPVVPEMGVGVSSWTIGRILPHSNMNPKLNRKRLFRYMGKFSATTEECSPTSRPSTPTYTRNRISSFGFRVWGIGHTRCGRQREGKSSFLNCLGVYHKSSNSGMCHYESSPETRRFTPSLRTGGTDPALSAEAVWARTDR